MIFRFSSIWSSGMHKKPHPLLRQQPAGCSAPHQKPHALGLILNSQYAIMTDAPDVARLAGKRQANGCTEFAQANKWLSGQS